jgi:GNAT superfamily N-acetyltransferase
MDPDDVEAAIVAVRDGGWGDRRQSLEFYVGRSDIHPFVAESDGVIVGTAIATQNGSVGWVGLVFVAPAWRGRGLGGQLTRAALDKLDELGCRSIALAATELGRPIYDRLGFRVDGGYVVLSGPTRPEVPTDRRVRQLLPSDVTAVCDMDRLATGEDRSHLIRALSAGGWVIDDGRAVRGYALRTPWGLGPAIAEDVADGALLLEVLRGQPRTSEMLMTVAANSEPAIEHLRAAGFVEQRRLPRMVLGEPVVWRPSWVWAIFGFAFG